MCLSTIYRNEKQANIHVDGDKLIFEDVMGVKTTVTGRLVSADLTAGSVIVASE